jgi:hypothetical protein
MFARGYVQIYVRTASFHFVFISDNGEDELTIAHTGSTYK